MPAGSAEALQAEFSQLTELASILFQMPVLLKISSGDLKWSIAAGFKTQPGDQDLPGTFSVKQHSDLFSVPRSVLHNSSFCFVAGAQLTDEKSNLKCSLFLTDVKPHRLTRRKKKLLEQVSGIFAAQIRRNADKYLPQAFDTDKSANSTVTWFGKK